MFSGVGTALITPLKNDLSVDFHSLKKIVEHQLKNNIDALIVLGTTGEAIEGNSHRGANPGQRGQVCARAAQAGKGNGHPNDRGM